MSSLPSQFQIVLDAFDSHEKDLCEIKEMVVLIQKTQRSLKLAMDSGSKEVESIHQSLECLKSENQGNIKTCQERKNLMKETLERDRENQLREFIEITGNYETINNRLSVQEESLRNVTVSWKKGLEARLIEKERQQDEDLQGMLSEAKRMLEDVVEPLFERIRHLEEFRNSIDMHPQPEMQVSETSLFEELKQVQPSNHVTNFAAIYSWMCLIYNQVLEYTHRPIISSSTIQGLQQILGHIPIIAPSEIPTSIVNLWRSMGHMGRVAILIISIASFSLCSLLLWYNSPHSTPPSWSLGDGYAIGRLYNDQ